jgi:hypothetical protein
MRSAMSSLTAVKLGVRRFGAGSAVLAALLVAPAAPAGATTARSSAVNVCHATGISRAVAKKIFPKLQSVSAGQTEATTTPPNFGVCEIVARNIISSLGVELWSASAFKQQTVTFTNDGKLQRLSGLGHGAFYSPVRGDKNDGNVLFERGAYTVLIYPNMIGGTSRDYPTEKQYVALARAIYKHLR